MTTAQDLIIRQIENSSFNDFNGANIGASLRMNEEIWRSVVFTNSTMPMYTPLKNPFDADYQPPPLETKYNLKSLTSLEQDSIHADHIFILAKSGNQHILEQLVQTWQANELSWYDAASAKNTLGVSNDYLSDYEDQQRILMVCWWD